MQQEKHIIKIEKKEAGSEGSIGKYLNNHIAPGYMYVVEDETNLLGSCLYNIDKPMMVITYKSYEQFLKEATKSELAANLSGLEKTSCNISDEMIAKKQLELVDKPIKFNTRLHTLDYSDIVSFGLQMNGHKVILIDDYQAIVEDWYQESPQKPIQTVLQWALKEEFGITVIVSKHPLITENNEPAEMTEPVLCITYKYGMEDRFEKAKIEIVRMKDNDESDDLGTAVKRHLVPSQFYIIEKTPETALSFYASLEEPSVVFSLTKSSTQFFNNLLWARVEADYQTGGIDPNDIGKIFNALENRPMWIDDSKIHSVEELYEKCLQMKAEQKIQFAVIDDFQNLPVPKRVMKGRAKPDYQQLCQIAKELDIVLVALVDPSANNTSEQC